MIVILKKSASNIRRKNERQSTCTTATDVILKGNLFRVWAEKNEQSMDCIYIDILRTFFVNPNTSQKTFLDLHT